MDILIFKTNINNSFNVQLLASYFTSMPQIKKWNVDLHDVDKVLRIEAENISINSICNIVQKAGFNCSELTD